MHTILQKHKAAKQVGRNYSLLLDILGISGHTGSDGSSMSARLNRYGDWIGKIGENIDFGGKTAKDIVLSLIVDDGVTNRGHRANLLSPDFVKTGVACAKHSQWEVCTVLDYASEYTVKGGNLSGTLQTDNTPKFQTNNGGIGGG